MTASTSPLPGSRPLLKWAGGKRQLLPVLRRYYPAGFDRYIEPFAGSAAVFFDLYAAGRLEGRDVRLADLNIDLIGCYRAVRDTPEAVLAALANLAEEHRARGAACYYDVRDCRFNPARAARHTREADPYPPELAAMFLYLNRTGFNGLFRLNRRGGFNVPAGRYAAPRIYDPEHVRACSRALSAGGGPRSVALDCQPFEHALADAGRGDFVYCDPPYAPLSRTASFASYTAAGFGPVDQRRLQQAILAAAGRGAVILISNSSAGEIERAYSSREARIAGLTVVRVAARRAINSRAALRGPVDELLITNAAPRPSLTLNMAKAALPAHATRGVPLSRAR